MWFNTGTLCNIACAHCYIESSPRNDRLAYLSLDDVSAFLSEATATSKELREIGFTGGEPFMNPDIIAILGDALSTGRQVTVLTNAMRPMQRHAEALLDLHRRHPGRISVRISIDHFEPARHEGVRGRGTWKPAIDGLMWLSRNDFDLAVAARQLWVEPESELRAGFARLFTDLGIGLNAEDATRLLLFPEMSASTNVPEITEACWAALGKHPSSVMCADARMVVKRKGAAKPVVVACTLLPYEPEFELGSSLADAAVTVPLNHPSCSRFCVLGGSSCSAGRSA